MGHLPGSTGQRWEKEKSEDVRKTNSWVFLKVFFFSPLISKFLLILVKRKNTSTPAACPPLQLLQAFKGRKLRDVLCPSLGAAPSLPHQGTCRGGVVSRCQALHYRCRKGRFKIRRGALARSTQNPPQKAAAQPLSQQMQQWRTWTCPEMHVVSPGHHSQNWGLCHSSVMGT